MVYTLGNQFMVMLLSLCCVFSCSRPVWLVILAGSLLVVLTLASVEEEENKRLTLAKGVVCLLFAIVSENCLGFVVVGLMDEMKKHNRVLVAVSAYIIVNVLSVQKYPMAHVLMGVLILAVALTIVLLLKWAFERSEVQKTEAKKVLLRSNISEMHEKRINQQLVMQNYLAEKNARLLERENISRNIHNSVGHSITAAVMTLDAADLLYEVRPADARKKMNEANERIRGSLESIRRAVRVLDEETQDMQAGDLKGAMEQLIQEFVMDTSIEVDKLFEELPDEVLIPHDHGEFLTGVLKELLTNGYKHGHASAYQIVLKGDNGHISLSVTDNGNSDFCEENQSMKIQQGFGLKKIMAYVERCGGEAVFLNENGFQAVVELPILPET